MANIIDIDDNSFEKEVIEASKNQLVVVDFWAPWCGGCQIFAPIFTKAAHQYPNVKFCKLDVNEHKEVANKLGIMSIPNTKFFKDGKPVDELIGAEEEKFKDLLKKHS